MGAIIPQRLMSLWDSLTPGQRRRLRMRRDYSACLMTPSGDELTPPGLAVMKDIASFCGAYRSNIKIATLTGAIDPIAMAMAEGRRQVFLHIQQRLKLTDDQILQMENTND